MHAYVVEGKSVCKTGLHRKSDINCPSRIRYPLVMGELPTHVALSSNNGRIIVVGVVVAIDCNIIVNNDTIDDDVIS